MRILLLLSSLLWVFWVVNICMYVCMYTPVPQVGGELVMDSNSIASEMIRWLQITNEPISVFLCAVTPTCLSGTFVCTDGLPQSVSPKRSGCGFLHSILLGNTSWCCFLSNATWGWRCFLLCFLILQPNIDMSKDTRIQVDKKNKNLKLAHHLVVRVSKNTVIQQKQRMSWQMWLIVFKFDLVSVGLSVAQPHIVQRSNFRLGLNV